MQLEYKCLAGRETMGGLGDFGIRIMVAVDHKLGVSVEFKDKLENLVYTLHDELLKDKVRQDPETGKRKEETKQKLLALFEDPIFAEEIPNEYWGPTSPWSLSSPWFVVTTRIGRIKIGWRKRVISIDWEGSKVAAYANHLFPAEDVTKEGRLIHAWGYEKAAEYIKTLMRQGAP